MRATSLVLVLSLSACAGGFTGPKDGEVIDTDPDGVVPNDTEVIVETDTEMVPDTDETDVAADTDDIGSASFAADIASMRHETQYSRLFRS